MAKAIVGSHADPRTFALLEEVRALRARVAALEEALKRAEEAVSRNERRVIDLDAETPLDTASSALA
ncbi:MAG: hypothetical protein M3N57_04345 [Actinomycetota bacterium]|nr:hypothetical protein [Actinomycetota bacterium]